MPMAVAEVKDEKPKLIVDTTLLYLTERKFSPTSSSPSASTIFTTESPSIGSQLHGSNLCKPCAWFWKKEGCLNGAECRHCHSCTYGELTRRKSENRRRNRRLSGVERRAATSTTVTPRCLGAFAGKDDVQCSPTSTSTEPERGPAWNHEGPLTPGMYRRPAAKSRDDEDFPSPQHSFQRSVTLPAMMEDEGYSGHEPPFASSSTPELSGSLVTSDFDTLEPWELPSPQHSGFHRSVTLPARMEGGEATSQTGSQSSTEVTSQTASQWSTMSLSEGRSMPPAHVMIIVPMVVAVVPMVLNRM